VTNYASGVDDGLWDAAIAKSARHTDDRHSTTPAYYLSGLEKLSPLNKAASYGTLNFFCPPARKSRLLPHLRRQPQRRAHAHQQRRGRVVLPSGGFLIAQSNLHSRQLRF